MVNEVAVVAVVLLAVAGVAVAVLVAEVAAEVTLPEGEAVRAGADNLYLY